MRSKTIISYKFPLFFTLILIFLLSACVNPLVRKTNNNINITVLDKPKPGQVAIIESDIIVTKPLSNDQITSPLEITGRTRVGEETILFRLKDDWNQVMATSSTKTEIGAPDWGFYSGSLDFPTPLSQTGWLEVYTQNSQDGSEQNLITLPITFKEYKQPRFTLVILKKTREQPIAAKFIRSKGFLNQAIKWFLAF